MKTKMKIRLLSILLVLVMMLAAVPFSALPAFAAEPESEIVEVGTWNELLNAVNSDKTHIKLTCDIEDTVPDDELPTKHRLVFDGGKEYILDLNGNKLTVGNYTNAFYTDNFSMIAVSNNSALQIQNGRITFENWYTERRTAKGVVYVADTSTLTATDVDMYNAYTGTVVYAADEAKVTLDGGDYTVQNGFALYLEGQAALTLDGGVWIGTRMGDSTATVYVDGYGALYSASSGELTVNNAYFNTGIQVHESQVGAFSTATHELVINGIKQAEDIYFSDAGNQFSALEAGKDYYWYKNGYSRALYKIESPLFANAVSVISYEKKYPIEVQNGVATIGGNTVTEVCYGQTVSLVAAPAESGMEFVRWDTNGVELTDYYSASTTFTMPAAPVYIAAYYGKESVKSVGVTVGDVVVGEKAYDTRITLDGGVKLESVEWYENLIKMEESDVFKPGKTYELKILVYPPDEHKFGDSVTATVNGKQATVNSDSGYAIIGDKFDALPENPFPVVYNTQTAQLGIGGLLELDTALMSSQSAEFKTAFDAGTATYQWYKDGEAIEGATDPVYNFTADDNGSRFYVIVTAGGKTAFGDAHRCYNHLYQIYLNASDFVAGGKAPQISSATPGVSIDPESLFICEGKGQPELDIQKTILIPGKTYLVVGTLVQTGEANIPYNAKVYVNDVLMEDTVDGTYRFFYKITVPEADYPVYYTANGEIGIGVTLTVDVDKMCAESGTFKHAVDVQTANPTYQTVFYQWYKNGEEIKGATEASYTVKTTDRDSYIHCKVTLVDGKYGIGDQHVITNVITVLNVQMPYPKDGEKIINSGIYADGVNLIGVMWWPKDTGNTMNAGDTYVEGTVYEYYLQFQAKDGFLLDFDGDMTVAYVYDKKVDDAGSVPNSGKAYYMGEVTAIHKHQYSDSVWDHDEYGHWQPCIVPGCPNPNEEEEGYVGHWGGNATCQTQGTCTQCGAEYYADHDFSVPDYQYVDEMKCANFCENCDLWIDWSYHEGGVSDCQNKSVCEFCHHEYGDFAPCSGGTPTCTEKAICDTCGEAYGETLPHDYGTEFKSDAMNHWNECACGDKANVAPHADENGDGACDACAYVLPKDEEESTESVPSESDPAETDPAESEPTESEPTESAPTESDPTESDPAESEPAETDPADPMPDNTPNGEEDGGLGAGAIVAIVVGSVAVVGIGGFALFWFVIKKKTWSDLIAVFKK